MSPVHQRQVEKSYRKHRSTARMKNCMVRSTMLASNQDPHASPRKEDGTMSESSGEHSRTTSETSTKFQGVLGLPAELRNEIWMLNVLHQSPIHAIGDTLTAVSHHLQQPPITKTCRLIRREALPLFYHVNTFIFHRNKKRLQADSKFGINEDGTAWPAVRWIDRLTAQQQSWLSKIVLRWRNGEMLGVGIAKRQLVKRLPKGVVILEKVHEAEEEESEKWWTIAVEC